MDLFKRLILLLFMSTGAFHYCSAQVNEAELNSLFELTDTVSRDYTSVVREADNDISTIVSVGFLIYKSIISSQDNPSCVFTPSCSEYAVQSIQKSGLFLGWLFTFDRLSRCHGLVDHHHYPFDPDTKRYYDPVH